MKTILLGVFTLIISNLNAQYMNNPTEVVTNLFITTDQKNWEEVEKNFSTTVLLDYSSMTNSAPTTLTPNQVIDAWKGILPGFEATHHQLGNFVSRIEGNKAVVFCYGTASHFLSNKKGNVWTVIGSYDFELVKNAEGAWKITTMKFNFKYQDGNTELAAQAIENVKNQKK